MREECVARRMQRDSSPELLGLGSDDKGASHGSAVGVSADTAVVGEGSGPVSPELESGSAVRQHSLEDSVLVDRKTVGLVLAHKFDLHDVFVSDLDPVRGELVVAGRDDELTASRRPLLTTKDWT